MRSLEKSRANSRARWRINAAIGGACLFLSAGCAASLETNILMRAKQASALPTLSDLKSLSAIMNVTITQPPGSLFFWDVLGGDGFKYPNSKITMSPVTNSTTRDPGIDPGVPAVTMSIYFETKNICVTIDDVIRIFGVHFQNIRENVPMWYSNTSQKYRGMPLGVAFFLLKPRPRRGISFQFDGKFCAISMLLSQNVSYY